MKSYIRSWYLYLRRQLTLTVFFSFQDYEWFLENFRKTWGMLGVTCDGRGVAIFRVYTGSRKPGKTGSFENLLYSSNKVFRISVLRNACRQERELILKSWEWNGLSWNLESWKNQSEFWESPWNLFLKKGTNPENCFSLHARNTGINWKDRWASWLEYRLYLNFKLVKD